MTCAVLSIGTELTRGELVNTNAAWLAPSSPPSASRCRSVGSTTTAAASSTTLERLRRQVRVIVCTGGLGPTTDDLTTEAVAAALGVRSSSRDEASLEHIRRRFEKTGRTMSDSNAKQADFPEGADILPNANGTAPGFGVRIGECARVLHARRSPRDAEDVRGAGRAAHPRPRAERRLSRSASAPSGFPRASWARSSPGVEAAFPGVTIGYRAHFPEIEVKVLARAASHDGRARSLRARDPEVRQRLAPVVYGEGEDTFAGVVGRTLRAQGLHAGHRRVVHRRPRRALLTREPGASDFLLIDAVTYANSAKSKLLGVEEETIRWHGAVSPEVAAAMAEGAKRVSSAIVALSLTGVAGPSGGTDAKPVGTVFIAVAGPAGTTVKERHFVGDRTQIQTWAAYAGLQLVREACA